MEAIGDLVENEEVVISTLNGLLRAWHGFIYGVCTRKKKFPRFNSVWEEGMQEEAWREAYDEKTGAKEDQVLTVHTKNHKERKSSKSPRKSQRPGKTFGKSKLNFFNCNESGRFKKDCVKLKEQKKKGKRRKHHAHGTKDDALAQKKVKT